MSNKITLEELRLKQFKRRLEIIKMQMEELQKHIDANNKQMEVYIPDDYQNGVFSLREKNRNLQNNQKEIESC